MLSNEDEAEVAKPHYVIETKAYTVQSRNGDVVEEERAMSIVDGEGVVFERDEDSITKRKMTDKEVSESLSKLGLPPMFASTHPKRKTSRKKKSRRRKSSKKKSRRRRKSSKKNGGGRARGCKRQATKKYITRPSPPFPANECCGKRKKGNDGKMWHSVPNKNGVCRWQKVKK